MKQITIALCALALVLCTSCSSRNDDIPGIIDNIEDAINNNDQAALKKYISEDARDYELLESGSFNFNDYIDTSTYEFSFTTEESDIPQSGSEIEVSPATVVSLVSGGSEVASGESAFLFTDESGIFGDDWKVLEIALPDSSGSQVNFLKLPEEGGKPLPGFLKLR